MKIASISGVEFFVTKDGSTIRELHHTDVQSLAEATLEPDEATQRHYHRATEEIYFVLKGSGRMEVDGDTRDDPPRRRRADPRRRLAHAGEQRQQRAPLPLLLRAAVLPRRHVLRVTTSHAFVTNRGV